MGAHIDIFLNALTSIFCQAETLVGGLNRLLRGTLSVIKQVYVGR